MLAIYSGVILIDSVQAALPICLLETLRVEPVAEGVNVRACFSSRPESNVFVFAAVVSGHKPRSVLETCLAFVCAGAGRTREIQGGH